MKIFGFSQPTQQIVTLNEDALGMYPKIYSTVKGFVPKIEESPKNMSYYITLSTKMDNEGVLRYTRGVKIIGKKAPKRSKGETLKLLWRKNKGNLIGTINDAIHVKAPQQSSTFDITEDGIGQAVNRVNKKVLYATKRTHYSHLKTSIHTATRVASR